MKILPLFVLCLLLAGCHSMTQSGGKNITLTPESRVVLAPFANATETPHAGEALTELAGSILMARGIPLYQIEKTTPAADSADSTDTARNGAAALNSAREAKAAYLIVGTVHEYRYKTDLKGNPAVGITLRIVDVVDGKTVWQGSTSKVGHGFASLTSTAQQSLQDLAERMPMRPWFNRP